MLNTIRYIGETWYVFRWLYSEIARHIRFVPLSVRPINLDPLKHRKYLSKIFALTVTRLHRKKWILDLRRTLQYRSFRDVRHNWNVCFHKLHRV